jgi:hypothetical protein
MSVVQVLLCSLGGALGLLLVSTTPFAPDDMTADLVETAPRETSPDPGETNKSEACIDTSSCVDGYLWSIYQRTPTRFGWKDAEAAERMGMSPMEFVIGGMDPVPCRALSRTANTRRRRIQARNHLRLSRRLPAKHYYERQKSSDRPVLSRWQCPRWLWSWQGCRHPSASMAEIPTACTNGSTDTNRSSASADPISKATRPMSHRSTARSTSSIVSPAPAASFPAIRAGQGKPAHNNIVHVPDGPPSRLDPNGEYRSAKARRSASEVTGSPGAVPALGPARRHSSSPRAPYGKRSRARLAAKLLRNTAGHLSRQPEPFFPVPDARPAASPHSTALTGWSSITIL